MLITLQLSIYDKKLMQEGKRRYGWIMVFSGALHNSCAHSRLYSGNTDCGNYIRSPSAGAVIGTDSGSFSGLSAHNVIIVIGVTRFQTANKANWIRLILKICWKNVDLWTASSTHSSNHKQTWHIYCRLLFGLGFDTASEVALIAISVGIGVSTSIPPVYILHLRYFSLRHGYSRYGRWCYYEIAYGGLSSTHTKDILNWQSQ